MKRHIPWRMIIVSFLFFLIAMTANYYASLYAVENAGNSVEDVILSNIPTFDVTIAFVYGPLLFWFVIAVVLARSPHKIPFVLDSIALFIIIRSGFITLTHIGIFPSHINVPRDFMGLFPTGADLFFSGHTALPYLMGLIFWDNFKLRIFSIISSVFFGVVVLLGHVHYSIDVAAAFFITYSVYHICIRAFKKDLKVFESAPIV